MRPIKLVFCALMGGGGVAACHRKHQTKVKLRWLHLPQPSDQLRFSMPQNLPDVTTVVVNLPRSNLCIDHLSVSLTNTTLHIFAIPNMLTKTNNLIRIVSITALCLFQAFLVSGLSPFFISRARQRGPLRCRPYLSPFPRHPPGGHSLIGAKTPVLPCPLLFVTPFTTVSTHRRSRIETAKQVGNQTTRKPNCDVRSGHFALLQCFVYV